ncbi:MAG: hypothetical protein RSA86_07265 [Christensenellaceae bacterium]
MTRLQQEVARKLYSLGCAFEYQNETGILNITVDDQPIYRLHSDGNYTYRSDEHLTKKQAEAFLKIENIIDTTKEYITAYENAPQFEIYGIEDYRKLSEFGGDVSF